MRQGFCLMIPRVSHFFELGKDFSKEVSSQTCFSKQAGLVVIKQIVMHDFWVRQGFQSGNQELGMMLELGKVVGKEVKSLADL